MKNSSVYFLITILVILLFISLIIYFIKKKRDTKGNQNNQYLDDESLTVNNMIQNEIPIIENALSCDNGQKMLDTFYLSDLMEATNIFFDCGENKIKIIQNNLNALYGNICIQNIHNLWDNFIEKFLKNTKNLTKNNTINEKTIRFTETIYSKNAKYHDQNYFKTLFNELIIEKTKNTQNIKLIIFSDHHYSLLDIKVNCDGDNQYFHYDSAESYHEPNVILRIPQWKKEQSLQQEDGFSCGYFTFFNFLRTLVDIDKYNDKLEFQAKVINLKDKIDEIHNSQHDYTHKIHNIVYLFVLGTECFKNNSNDLSEDDKIGLKTKILDLIIKNIDVSLKEGIARNDLKTEFTNLVRTDSTISTTQISNEQQLLPQQQS
jgi:hypothetical protein